MKNITVCIDDAVYHAARVVAAKNRTSVSALVRNYLSAVADGKAPALADEGDAEGRKDREELVRLFEEANLVLGYRPNRDTTYER